MASPYLRGAISPACVSGTWSRGMSKDKDRAVRAIWERKRRGVELQEGQGRQEWSDKEGGWAQEPVLETKGGRERGRGYYICSVARKRDERLDRSALRDAGTKRSMVVGCRLQGARWPSGGVVLGGSGRAVRDTWPKSCQKQRPNLPETATFAPSPR